MEVYSGVDISRVDYRNNRQTSLGRLPPATDRPNHLGSLMAPTLCCCLPGGLVFTGADLQ